MPGLLEHEIPVELFASALNDNEHKLVIDVREEWELQLSRLKHPTVKNIPINQIMSLELEDLKNILPIEGGIVYILCHHGIRSERVAKWLWSLGLKNSFSVFGGIDLYARMIDSSVGSY